MGVVGVVKIINGTHFFRVSAGPIILSLTLAFSSYARGETIIVSCPVNKEGATVWKYNTSLTGEHKWVRFRRLGVWEHWCTDLPNGSLSFGDRSARCEIKHLDHEGGSSIAIVDFFLKEYVILDRDKKTRRWTCDLVEHRPY